MSHPLFCLYSSLSVTFCARSPFPLISSTLTPSLFLSIHFFPRLPVYPSLSLTFPSLSLTFPFLRPPFPALWNMLCFSQVCPVSPCRLPLTASSRIVCLHFSPASFPQDSDPAPCRGALSDAELFIQHKIPFARREKNTAC